MKQLYQHRKRPNHFSTCLYRCRRDIIVPISRQFEPCGRVSQLSVDEMQECLTFYLIYDSIA